MKFHSWNYLLALIDMQWQNNIVPVCQGRDEFCKKLKQFLGIQLDWIYDQISSYPNDDYWHHVCPRARERESM